MPTSLSKVAVQVVITVAAKALMVWSCDRSLLKTLLRIIHLMGILVPVLLSGLYVGERITDGFHLRLVESVSCLADRVLHQLVVFCPCLMMRSLRKVVEASHIVLLLNRLLMLMGRCVFVSDRHLQKVGEPFAIAGNPVVFIILERKLTSLQLLGEDVSDEVLVLFLVRNRSFLASATNLCIVIFLAKHLHLTKILMVIKVQWKWRHLRSTGALTPAQ